ncbi:twin-arginine translocase subunit TatC [Planctomycetota bacterium]
MGKTKDRYDLSISTMSLGDHLEELRSRLILALLGLLLGTIVCLFFGKKIILFVQRPYNVVMMQHLQKAMSDPNTSYQSTLFGNVCANLVEQLQTDPNAPALDPNTVQYIQRVYLETITSVGQRALTQKGRPLIDSATSRYRLQTLAPADAFIGYMKISLISGLLLSAPWVFYQIWMFVAAGLYAHERKSVQAAIPFSAALFIVGALFFLFIVAPISLRFFLSFGNLIGLACSWTFQKYISFVTILMLVFGIAFQTPIAIFILNRTGLVTIAALRGARKFVILGIFIVAAIATPPDVISQITLALPLYCLYELGILLSASINKQPIEDVGAS